MATKSEEELRKIAIEMRMLEHTAEALQSRINMVNAVTNDLTIAKMTLEGLEKENEKSEILVPIGGTSYIRAKLDNIDKVIVGMGAGVSVERTRQEAKDIVNKRLADLEKARGSLQQQFAQVAEKVAEDREKAEALASTMKEGTPH